MSAKKCPVTFIKDWPTFLGEIFENPGRVDSSTFHAVLAAQANKAGMKDGPVKIKIKTQPMPHSQN